MTTAADHYRDVVTRATEQSQRVLERDRGADRWATRAASFRADPHRELDANLAFLASYVEPSDVLIDVGGGAGRHSLPLALRCREVINVEPSVAMAREFVEAAESAGIANSRLVAGDWPLSEPLAGDIALVANVTYFVPDIVPFVEALVAAASRRVMITVWSVPPPARAATLFAVVHSEPQEIPASHRELLPVLWDMGILPDVLVMPDAMTPMQPDPVLATIEDAVEHALAQVDGQRVPGAAEHVREHLGSLFTQVDGGFRPAWRPAAREMLITWSTEKP